MANKYTVNDFINRARSIHGDKYDYSKVIYKGNNTKVCIICPKHGEFWQLPNNHINMKQGCSKCYHESVKRPVYGVGINDTDYVFETKEYKTWRDMLERCYCKTTQEKFPTYNGCTVCDDWLLFSNFKKWFNENYIDGWELDKDILVIGNQVYSPQTCCFVPRKINSFLRESAVHKNSGIYKLKNGKYKAAIRVDGKVKYLGVFETFNDAKNKRDEEFNIKLKKVVGEFENLMPLHVYEACLNYNRALYIDKQIKNILK